MGVYLVQSFEPVKVWKMKGYARNVAAPLMEGGNSFKMYGEAQRS